MTFLDSLERSGGLIATEPVGAALQSSFKPTPEQEAIIAAAEGTTDNLIIEALAGAAKTSTLVLVANRPTMQSTATLCLAFNKKIADEMKNRLPSNCTAMTLNSLGHKVWGQQLGKRLTLNTKKNADILAALIKEQRKDIQDRLWDQYSDLLRTLAHGKSQGWVPNSCRRRVPKAILDDNEFFESLDEELDDIEAKLLTTAMNTSIDQSYSGLIDFDDQIYMSTCFPSRFPSYPLTMIDEAQDLSALNHSMLEQIVADNRLFAVGDPCQAIYAFRGAYGNSMDLLRERFSMTVLTLSTSFRCPRAVVREAQWRAPHMAFPEWAKEGEVRNLGEWGVENLTADAVIICRNNAPIFSMAIRLLREGRYPQIVGNDIGKTLIKALKKLGDANISQAAAFEELENYKRRRLSKAREHARASVEDFCSCMAVFLEKGDTLGAAIAYADYLMNQTGPIKMMTGHKSKGLEFHHVYILDRQLLRVKDDDKGSGKNQDKNLLYVMQTRAQETLTYITSETFVGSEPTGE